uniref:Uncharacterized protein n=1 Tax=Chromera velia CCMP2878 TaxID=1169474 RepID=A0A0G4HG01_9ALVE|eukprot:Cvel_6709.t1-p1 / transcript=Cvel_6709.t1 / gene=Cvel_6709 / organism=Chromera_velia_CCMP2878 / gene_product=hypothetical protein / transcript_product=hypothetical protein / location=Cvel_scaffold335:10445-11572(-) / protein_length=376 / sequence_SO=supercontig / SO=protein_coding / is_pseudo=false
MATSIESAALKAQIEMFAEVTKKFEKLISSEVTADEAEVMKTGQEVIDTMNRLSPIVASGFDFSDPQMFPGTALAAQLSLAYLRAAAHACQVQYAPSALNLAGILAESFDLAPELTTEEHASLYLAFIKKVVNRIPGELIPTVLEGIDHALCPPGMVFLSRHLDLLARWRKENPQVSVLPKSMLRELLNMLVDESVLFLHFDTTSQRFTYGQRVKWRGPSCNGEMRDEVQAVFPELIRPGVNMEMVNWTAMKDIPHTVAMSGQGVQSPHRIWMEGIPADIAELNGEKVVIFFQGSIARSMAGTHTFCRIPCTLTVDGPSLTSEQLTELMTSMRAAPADVQLAALRHQKGTGGSDGLIEALIQKVESSAFGCSALRS